MKRLYTFITMIAAIVLCMAAQGVNFSLTLIDNEGNPQPSTEANLRLSLTVGEAAGEAAYVETHNVTSNPYGVVHATLGAGTTVAGVWNEIDWSLTPMYLHVERADNSGNYSTMSILPLGAVPYAYHAQKAEALTLYSPNGSAWDVTVDNNGNLGTSMSAPADAPDYGTVDYIFDTNALPVITIEITTEEWNTFLTNYDLNPNNEDCVHANFYFNKYGRVHSLQDIGLRLRGGTSRVRPEGSYGSLHEEGNRLNHFHMGFRFQKFHKDDPEYTLSGTDRFNLKWAKEDPTYVREMYGYDLMRRFGVYTAARNAYCRVYIKFVEEENPVYVGVFNMLECYEDQYLADMTAKGNFAGTKGYLWKGGWGSGQPANFSNADRNLMGIENVTLDPTETESYTYDYKSKKKQLETAKDQLVSFIENLNSLQGDEFREWAEGAIDIDLLLRGMAVEVAIGHWDDFWYNGNNFYMYFDNDGDGRMRYIPYDMDNTLGSSVNNFDPATQNPLQWGNSPLAVKVLSIPEWKNKYIGYLRDLANPANDYIDASRSADRIRAWQDMIREFVANDTQQDNSIYDSPCSWGGFNYHLLDSNNNFFDAKVRTINNIAR